MADVYQLEPPNGTPVPPICWSWSALSSWRRCPRQWWLLRAHYPNASTPYPQPLRPAAVEGTLLHLAVAAFIEHLRNLDVNPSVTDYDIRASFNIRRFIQSQLPTVVSHIGNPRVDVPKLMARVSVDDCVNAFRQVAPSCISARRQQRLAGAHSGGNLFGVFGSEVWVEVTDPPLCGRIDLSTPSGIVDFKTGSPSDEHADQVRFYALLVWLRSGVVPQKLTLVYVNSGREVEISPPDLRLLSEMQLALRSEIAQIVISIGQRSVPAIPAETNCNICPVRQLCSAYWSAAETKPLRLSRVSAGQEIKQRQWLDVELTRLPTLNRARGYAGVGTVPEVGEVQISIGPSFADSAPATGARLLNAFVEGRNGTYSVAAGASTEVFWIRDGARLDEQLEL